MKAEIVHHTSKICIWGPAVTLFLRINKRVSTHFEVKKKKVKKLFNLRKVCVSSVWDCSSAKHADDSIQLKMYHTPYALGRIIKQVTQEMI